MQSISHQACLKPSAHNPNTTTHHQHKEGEKNLNSNNHSIRNLARGYLYNAAVTKKCTHDHATSGSSTLKTRKPNHTKNQKPKNVQTILSTSSLDPSHRLRKSSLNAHIPPHATTWHHAFLAKKHGGSQAGRLDSTRVMGARPHAAAPAAAPAARQARDDDVEEGDDGVDDGCAGGADGVHDGHEAVADGAEDGLDLC